MVISVLGHVASIVGPGTATPTVVQSGNAQYEGAAAVTPTVTVEPLMVSLSGAPNWLGDYVLMIQGNMKRLYDLLYQNVLQVGTRSRLVTISNLPAPTLQFSVPATNAVQFYRLERPVYPQP